jgi:hypothetical protein
VPLELPVIDDRNYEQLLAEAKRRIPAHTPEWTTYNVESDPGITLVELFAFLTDNLLYRAQRIPENNRLKFLQLLGIPLQQAAAATGFVTIQNDRGPLAAQLLEEGIVVAAGNSDFITRDAVTVLPLESRVYYKRLISEEDEQFELYKNQYEALLVAQTVGQETPAEGSPDTVVPDFYETTPMTLPTAANPNPVLDLANDAIDKALYVALLAPQNVNPELVREAIANKTLSVGVVPALSDALPPLAALRTGQVREPLPDLIFEYPGLKKDTQVTAGMQARYERLTIWQQDEVLSKEGIVKIALPDQNKLYTWNFPEPMQEGSGNFPPKLEDEAVSQRLVTWIRVRLPQTETETLQAGTLQARFSWVGINVTRVTQAVPVVNELLGKGNGEPDQSFSLANRPILKDSIRLEVEKEGDRGNWKCWRLVEDLLAAETDEEVFTLDPEAGRVMFGTGLNGKRPLPDRRLRVSYEYGGGVLGNVAIKAINKSADVRLQSGFKISNPLPTTGGDAGETTSEGERRIPAQIRHRDRTVTVTDFRDITERTPGADVGRVEILPTFDPHKPDHDTPGAVTVMVVPRSDKIRPLWPTPDRLFLQRVCEHLDQRRLITTEIHVVGPTYISVYLSVGIQIREGHVRDAVIQAVRDRLRNYLSALGTDGPDGTEGNGWPLRRRLLEKDLEAVVTRVSGVSYVNSLYMGIGSSVSKSTYDLASLELPLLEKIEVREGEAESLANILGDADTDSITPPTIRPIPIPIARSKC